MIEVRAKKHLGQHFLTDPNTARKIAGTLSDQVHQVIEIGPGTGMLTKFLLERNFRLFKAIEVDRESIAFLKQNYPQLGNNLLEGDFLRQNLSDIFDGPFAVTGNFPYNISSQILFKILEFHPLVTELTGMFQKEVAERVVAPHGNKIYGILSVLIQIYYDTEYLFTVNENVFNPPPSVKSAVIRLVLKPEQPENLNKALLFQVVKSGFNQRRKTLRNALSGVCNMHDHGLEKWASKRAEQLSPAEFIELTNTIEQSRIQPQPHSNE